MLGASVNFWRSAEKVGRQFFFIKFLIFEISTVRQVRGRTLIGPEFQSFEARDYSFWIGAPYICIIDCVKKNLDQTLRSGFLIGGVESTPPRITQRSQMPDLIGLRE
jgi:hypothetical protein